MNTATHRLHLLALLALTLGWAPAQALNLGLSQDDVVSPGGFLDSGSGRGAGAGTNPGAPIGQLFSAGPGTFQSGGPFSGNGTSSTSTSFLTIGSLSGETVHNSASSGTAGLGFVRGQTRSFSRQPDPGNPDPEGGFFSLSAINGGWQDRITVTAPGLTGADAVWTFHVDIDARLNGEGINGASILHVRPFLNHEAPSINVPGFDRGDSVLIATDFQYAQYRARSIFLPPAATVDVSNEVDDQVTFAVPVVLGEPFDLGVFAELVSSTLVGTSLFAQFDSGAFITALNTIAWGGSAGLTVGGVPVTDFTVTSLSGVDWTEPFAATTGGGDTGSVPAPAPWLLMLAGPLAMLGARARGGRATTPAV